MRICNPYDQLVGGQWLCGNLHAHTNRSDGSATFQEVLDRYAAFGHRFLMISDHDIYTSADDYVAMDDHGMILIPGNEISARGPHMLHVNADRRIEPHADRQRVLDEINASRGFAIFNHPNWRENFNHCPQELLEACNGYVGIEIYNGVIGRLHGSPYATDRWDMLLGCGRRIWGFATDDAHHVDSDVGLGWTCAYVREPSIGGLLDALTTGRFVASTGVVITDIAVQGNRIRIETENAERIVALRQVGRRFATADARSIEVEVPDDATYVRFECWGRGEQFAWTQPFFIER